jgi:DNA-binding response OmpR family regulator
MRVLIVEDEIDLAAALARGLRREGLTIDLADDGDDGFEKSTSVSYDVVVLDRDLRAVSADAVCRRIAVDGRSARILMLSAQDGVEDVASGLAAGADDYLVKPFDFRELVRRLKALERPLLASGC